MTPETARLAQLAHALDVAASVPDADDPDVLAYLHHVLSADPAEVAKAAAENSSAR